LLAAVVLAGIEGAPAAFGSDRLEQLIRDWIPPPSGVVTKPETAKAIAVALWKGDPHSTITLDDAAFVRQLDAKLDGEHWVVSLSPPKPSVGGGGLTMIISRKDGRIEAAYASQ
jgi:hypothetical protein